MTHEYYYKYSNVLGIEKVSYLCMSLASNRIQTLQSGLQSLLSPLSVGLSNLHSKTLPVMPEAEQGFLFLLHRCSSLRPDSDSFSQSSYLKDAEFHHQLLRYEVWKRINITHILRDQEDIVKDWVKFIFTYNMKVEIHVGLLEASLAVSAKVNQAISSNLICQMSVSILKSSSLIHIKVFIDQCSQQHHKGHQWDMVKLNMTPRYHEIFNGRF